LPQLKFNLSEEFIYIYFLIFVIGTIFGSFSNVLIYRLPSNKKGIFFGRSNCPKCKKQIIWYDNIPLISFLLLQGKCRTCNKQISFQYFVVELLSGLTFVLIFYSHQNIFDILLLILIYLIFLNIFFIDLKHFIIPDSLNILLAIVGFVKNFIPITITQFQISLQNSIIGGIVGFLLIYSIIFLYRHLKNREGMGLGDAKLMVGIGLLLGWQSIPIILFLASILGLIFVIPSLIKKTKKLTTQIPFGPFIILSSVIFFLIKDNFLLLFLI
jgi:leader peptidase (prepilin peptidase)/N-methyltransferase